jgi:hypothetical protein
MVHLLFLQSVVVIFVVSGLPINNGIFQILCDVHTVVLIGDQPLVASAQKLPLHHQQSQDGLC